MSKVRVKICGITNVADARLASDLGADAIGLNFYSGSPRFVAAERVEEILDTLRPATEPVALFVNEPLAKAAAFLKRWPRIRTIQWHGVAPESSQPTGFAYWPAFAIRTKDSLDRVEGLLQIEEFLEKCTPQALLVDGHDPKRYGGTGQQAPWELLASFDPGLPVILAGGLTPDNVAEAIGIVRPWMVDVASGVEARPGVKDPDKVRRFIENARAAG